MNKIVRINEENVLETVDLTGRLNSRPMDIKVFNKETQFKGISTF